MLKYFDRPDTFLTTKNTTFCYLASPFSPLVDPPTIHRYTQRPSTVNRPIMQGNRVILWFRQDLRLHDNEALQDAMRHGKEIIPVYVFDERLFLGKTSHFGFAKTGKYRAQFIIDSVKDLRESLRKLGSDLYVRMGKTEEVLFDMARELKTSWIFCNRERTRDEEQIQDALEKKLWSVGQEIRYSRGKMLYYTEDLPFPVTHTPDTFAGFRKEVERFIQVRQPLPTPTEKFPYLTVRIEAGEIPSIQDLGHENGEQDERAAISHKGGETEALKRLQEYFHDSKAVEHYKKTHDDLLGRDYSSKFSAWLAQGCLSPKTVYYELKRFESQNKKNKSTYLLFYELMWRDYLRLLGKKHGDKIFQRGGIRAEPVIGLKDDWQLFQVWLDGRTGVPFIDANMHEIAATGYMSNRGRQNVASFLIKDLQVNWQMGAEYFESILIDYDVTSNWGNWNVMGGVSTDSREDRYYNILAQSRRYDPQGEYIKLWLPELAKLPCDKVHRPDTLSDTEQEALCIRLGADYPKSMVNMKKWA